MLNRLDALIPPGEAGAVLHAMLLGDRGALDDSLRNAFRLSGAYHVLVISGLHIGVLAFSLFWLFRAAGASDEEIHATVQVCAYFNYINRVADALGVDLEPEMRRE